MEQTEIDYEKQINDYSRFLNSEENIFKFITPENSIIIQLLRALQKGK